MPYRKRFGQNFLQNKQVVQKIVAAIAPQKTDNLVEIGPGLGALTTALLPLVKTIDAIELDRDLIPKLQRNCQNLGNLNIHQVDALKFDFKNLVKTKHSLRIFGNLPYNISTPLLFHLLQQIDYIRDMHFMLQKEVVQRLSANIGTKNYGRLTVMIQYFCQAESLFNVSPGSFYPVPKVNSAVVRLIPHRKITNPVKNMEIFANVVKQAFSQRRKTIHNSLRGLLSDDQLTKLNIDPKLRPEQMPIADFVNIGNYLWQHTQ